MLFVPAGFQIARGKWLKNELNKPHAFKGEVLNSDMIGKTFDELIARWNEEHPDDPIK